jgi:hypothetical protein
VWGGSAARDAPRDAFGAMRNPLACSPPQPPPATEVALALVALVAPPVSLVVRTFAVALLDRATRLYRTFAGQAEARRTRSFPLQCACLPLQGQITFGSAVVSRPAGWHGQPATHTCEVPQPLCLCCSLPCELRLASDQCTRPQVWQQTRVSVDVSTHVEKPPRWPIAAGRDWPGAPLPSLPAAPEFKGEPATCREARGQS